MISRRELSAVILLISLGRRFALEPGDPFTLINQVQTECELEGLTVGSRLSDAFNSYDETTERDQRLHHDYLAEHLGFSKWIQSGVWKDTGVTPNGINAKELQRKGGWADTEDVSKSAYWPLRNKWIYFLGDSTLRQVWATMVASIQNTDFDQEAKQWSREQCDKQAPHRKEHPDGGVFPDEGWAGRCGVNEVTCNLQGQGDANLARLTYDWKHFPVEDYDDWLFGEEGVWRAPAHRRTTSASSAGVGRAREERREFHAHVQYANETSPLLRRGRKLAEEESAEEGVKAEVKVEKNPFSLASGRVPDVLVLQVGLHTCEHAFQDVKSDGTVNPNPGDDFMNEELVKQHENSIKTLMDMVSFAVSRAAGETMESQVSREEMDGARRKRRLKNRSRESSSGSGSSSSKGIDSSKSTGRNKGLRRGKKRTRALHARGSEMQRGEMLAGEFRENNNSSTPSPNAVAHAISPHSQQSPFRRLEEGDKQQQQEEIEEGGEEQNEEEKVGRKKTLVIVVTAGRRMLYNFKQDQCTWHMNRVLVHQAHKHGFPVLEREEIEHRLMFKSEHNSDLRFVEPDVHLDIPGPQIVATSLLRMMACLMADGGGGDAAYKPIVRDPWVTTF